MKTTQYLDAVKRKLGIESDYALAARLDLTRFGVSKLRSGISAMGTTTAVKVAEILNLDPMKVIADCELERGTDDVFWQRIAKKVAVVVLVPLACAALLLTPLSSEAATLFNNNEINAHCARRLLRRALAWLFGRLPGFADGALA